MDGGSFFLAVGGLIAIYAGVRFVVAREIPVVDEGGFKPLAWIRGKEAVVLGCAIVLAGVVLLCAAAGLIHLS